MNRSEILFLYDIADANPNGDPLDDNKPRLDEENEINLVTDVRLKRTIRDYLHDFKNQELFIKEIKDNDGNIQDAKQRAADFFEVDKKYEAIEDARKDIKENIVSKCIDVRLFGATIPIEPKIKSKKKTGSVTLTGPVQFRMGRSLHKVEIQHIKGTGAFASGGGKDQKTFREEYIVPYSLIAFYGVINENAAKETKLTDDDVSLLMDGIWNGTKNLVSRSKFGQLPRFLMQVEYNENNYFIGDLNNKISISHDLEDDKKIRNIAEINLDLSELLKAIIDNKDKVSKVNYKFDAGIKFVGYSSVDDLLDEFKSIGIETEEINF